MTPIDSWALILGGPLADALFHAGGWVPLTCKVLMVDTPSNLQSGGVVISFGSGCGIVVLDPLDGNMHKGASCHTCFGPSTSQ